MNIEHQIPSTSFQLLWKSHSGKHYLLPHFLMAFEMDTVASLFKDTLITQAMQGYLFAGNELKSGRCHGQRMLNFRVEFNRAANIVTIFTYSDRIGFPLYGRKYRKQRIINAIRLIQHPAGGNLPERAVTPYQQGSSSDFSSATYDISIAMLCRLTDGSAPHLMNHLSNSFGFPHPPKPTCKTIFAIFV